MIKRGATGPAIIRRIIAGHGLQTRLVVNGPRLRAQLEKRCRPAFSCAIEATLAARESAKKIFGFRTILPCSSAVQCLEWSLFSGIDGYDSALQDGIEAVC